MKLNDELKEELINTANIRSSFYHYFFESFVGNIQDNFIDVTKLFMPYFNDLAEYIDDDNFKSACFSLEKLVNSSNFQPENINHEFSKIFSNQEELLNDIDFNWDEIIDIFNRKQFNVTDDIKNPIDYICIEMLYMQKLNDLLATYAEKKEINKIYNTIYDQIDFLQNHITNWINVFTAYVMKKVDSVNSSFYHSISIIMNGFVFYDIELTKELLEAIQEQSL